MSESFKPSKESSPKELSPEKKYAMKPAAEPRIFSEESEPGTEYFLFPPITISIAADFSEEELFLSETEKGYFKFSKESVAGDYEITCCARAKGDTNRIDKMINGLDSDNPWQPAKLEHLLYLRAVHPESIPDSAVIAYGTVQRHHMPRLQSDGRLVKHYQHGGFNSNLYFLIARRN